MHDVLPAPLTRAQLRPMISAARRHLRSVERGALLLAVDLRRLQDAGAHLTYGRESFGAWAEGEFENLSADTAKKLSAQGRVMLELADEGRVDLGDPRTFPGTTGVRALAGVADRYGTDGMLAVYDACPADRVVAATVAQAAARTFPPPRRELKPPAPVDQFELRLAEEPEPPATPLTAVRSIVFELADVLEDPAAFGLDGVALPAAILRRVEELEQAARRL